MPQKEAIPVAISSLAPVASDCSILFLCTGNYYRSRFAEELFNHLATSSRLPHRAVSLGFTPHPDINPGAISKFALAGLAARQVEPQNGLRMPKAVTIRDFDAYTRCIALCDREHRPMMQRLFPSQMQKVTFWHVEDLAFETPDRALAEIEKLVCGLINELGGTSH